MACRLRLIPSLLCVFAVFHKGLTALIQTQPTTTGLAGDQVCLQCQLTEPKDVHQVTWQKILPEGEKNVGTFNKYSPPRVDPAFIGKVKFKEVGLRNSSIVILELTEEDEGLYQCLFNCYPEGVLIGKTWLNVFKLHGPVLHLRESKSSEELIVSCSATGRPAPTLTITAPQKNITLYEPVSFIHHDSSVTVNQTAVLSGLHDNSTQISCAAQVPYVPVKEVFLMIPEVRLVPTVEGFEEESKVNHRGRSRTVTIALVATLILICVSALIFLLLKARKKPNGASGETLELDERCLQTVRLPHEAETSAEENISIRQQISPEKNQESKNITPSPSAARRLSF